jgi:outer membrane murein-binding lipoprotein Lpp
VKALAAALAATLLLTGCRGGSDDSPRPVLTQYLDDLSTAIEGLNAARARLADDANAIGVAAAALDDVDDVAVTGNRDAARNRRPAADRAMPKASAAARRLNTDVVTYRRSVTALDEARDPSLTAAQQRALDDVVAAARKEVAQLKSYATVIASVWPRYERYDENQKLWLLRSSGGWYRDTKEAAGGYAVLNDRATLARDRRSLASADQKRLAATRMAGAAIATARGALAALLG